MYLRTCSITAQAAGGQTFDLSQLRCRFHIKQRMAKSPATCVLKITNQLPDTARLFTQVNAEFTTLTIAAGYQDDGSSGMLFSGNIVQAIYGRETNVDTLMTIMASDAHQAHNYGTVNTTLAKGSTPQDHINQAVQAMSKYGVTLGFLGPSLNLSTPVYPRAVTLFGMARDTLANVAKAKGAEVFYSNGTINMLGPTDNLPGGTVKLNSQTGLVGMPTSEIGGVMARSLINTAIKVGGLVQIDQGDVQGLLQGVQPDGQSLTGPNTTLVGQIASDGLFRVFQIDIDGDTRGTPFYMNLGMLAAGQSATSSALAVGAFPNPAASAAGAAQFQNQGGTP